MGFEIEGVEKFAASIDALIALVEKATLGAVVEGASLIETKAKRNFFGQHPPGTPRPDAGAGVPRPYAVTENLKQSIGRHPQMPEKIGRGVYRQSVYPTMAYARRVELGFIGTDSLGRDYTNPGQPAYPYLKPAVRDSLPQLKNIFEFYWNRAMKE